MFWKTLIWLARHLIWGPPMVLLWFVLVHENKAGMATEMGDRRVGFPINRLLQWGRLVLVAYFAFWSAYRVFHRNGHYQLLDSVIDAMLALTLLFAVPGAIVVSDEGITQARWYWRKKFIPWQGIAEISTGKGGGIVTVKSASKVTVVHGPPLPDRRRFMREIGIHCGDNLPPEFPRE